MQRTRSWLVFTIFSLISAGAFAQHTPFQQERRPKFPGWVSDKGYWVVESNINTPLNHIISFYNNDNELLYKETLIGVKMKLKKVLKPAVLTLGKNDGLICVLIN